jgi:hypothetical protein
MVAKKVYFYPMKSIIFSVALLSMAFNGLTQSLSSADIIKKSIAFHDPESTWSTFQGKMTFSESRPDGSIRNSYAVFDLQESAFEIYRADNYHFAIENDVFQLIEGQLEEERGRTMRDYYLYLWGLPMKLNDEGTKFGQTIPSNYQDKPTFKVEVIYEEDTWYFEIDQTTYQMLSYSFFKKADPTHGERIELNELVTHNTLKIPKSRSWYQLPEEKFLGTDLLDKIEP